MNTKVRKNPYFDEPKKIVNKGGVVYKILEYGNIFKPNICGVPKNIKPFVAISVEAGWTEVGVGYLSEDNKLSFWGIHDYNKGVDSPCCKNMKGAMAILEGLGEIKGDTLANCYYVTIGIMGLVDGKFTKEEPVVDEKTKIVEVEESIPASKIAVLVVVIVVVLVIIGFIFTWFANYI
jgi:hypothetical protein